jgi:predicted ATP-grasp superfamily ATP-dependent carboligase
VRAAAASAAVAGFKVTAIDAFGDRDQHPSVHSLALPRDFGVPFSARAAARAGQRVVCDAVVYLSNFENYPPEVATLAAGRTLWGNPPAVLRRVRNPLLVSEALRKRGLAAPEVSMESASKAVGRWLVKPLTSGGGHGVRRWRGATLPRGCYRQRFVNGTPGSVVFVGAGRRAVPIGLSRQLVGEAAFGSTGYRYCGSILAAAGDPQFGQDEGLAEATEALATVLAEEFNLVGVNGIDFVARDGSPFVVEVNPRWSASMELIEHAYGLSVFQAHAAACTSDTLPQFDLKRARSRGGALGKAVVFARQDVTLGDTHEWLVGRAAGQQTTVSDVPQSGQRIAAGRPVCTVFARGVDAAACHAELVRCAERVYADLNTWGRGKRKDRVEGRGKREEGRGRVEGRE